MENKIHVPNHQPGMVILWWFQTITIITITTISHYKTIITIDNY